MVEFSKLVNFYDILEVSKSATPADIKRQFKKLVMKYHPDRPSGDIEMFKSIQKAYETLIDDDKRRIYNAHLVQKNESYYNIPDDDDNDDGDEDDEFKFRRNSSYRRMSRNKDITITVEVDLFDVLLGKHVTCKLTFADGRSVEVALNIPKGVEDGDVIRFSEIGDDTLYGSVRGDVLVAIVEKEDDLFERDDENVYTTHWISAFTAMYDSSAAITSFDRSTVNFDIPAGTQPGTIITLRNRGLPVKNSSGLGDLKINVCVYIPTELEKNDVKLVKQLAAKYNLKS